MNEQSNTSVSAVPVSAQSLRSLRIKHTRIAQVMSELDTLIYPGSQDSILLVCGPTGVGKSTLALQLVQMALAGASAQMEANAGLIPAVYVQAPASGENDFSWTSFYQRILDRLSGDLDLPKVAYGVDANTGRAVWPRGASRNTLAALRTAVERGLRERGTRFLVIDEAAHIIRQTRRNRLEIQLDTLKSLANECGTQMVLIGSYDLYQLVSLSGQLARRTHVLHFERYRQDQDADLRAFRACVLKFQAALPELWGDQLLPHAEVLQENTLGCVGTLSSVLMRAAMLAQQTGGWSVDALQRALLTDAQRQRILEEILDGEAAINAGLTRHILKAPASRSRVQKRGIA